ncbi:MAG: Spy/CpxP family protein refolding chaperone [Armatimonadota bacterium]|jgi:Spy/CpxP family protein refolding chaperone
MRSKLVILLVIVALAFSAMSVMAQRGPKAGPAAGPGMGACQGQGWGVGVVCEQLKAQLNLTPAQVAQIEAIRKDCAASTQGAQADIQALSERMAQLWKADNPNAEAIKDLAAQIDAVRATIRNSRIDHSIAAFNVLNADQKAKVRSVACKAPGMCLGAGCGLCCGAGCGMGMGPGAGKGLCPGAGCGLGPGAGQGRNMGRGMGPGAGGANCPYAK